MLVLLQSCTSGSASLLSDSAALGSDSSDVSSGARPVATTTASETAYNVSWDTQRAADGWVEYGLDGAFDHRIDATDDADGLHHAATLSALAAGESWTWRVVSRFADRDETTDGGEIEVPPAPRELPELNITLDDGGAHPGFILGTSPFLGVGLTAVWVADRQGRYVWWNISPTSGPDEGATTEAWISADGAWVEWVAGLPGDTLYRMRLDKTEAEEISVPGIHHDFAPLPGGGWATFAQREGTQDGRTIIGDAIVEVAPDGTITEVFSSLDSLALDVSTGEELGYAVDCTHFNGIFYNAPEDAYYVSSWVRSSVVVIRREDGALLREIGGPASDLRLTAGEVYLHPHGPRIFPNGELVVMDNGDAARMSSRVAAYTLDLQGGTFSESWSFAPEIYASAMGNADAVAEGGTFISWAVAGRLSELDAAHEEVWRADASLGGMFGYAHLLPSFLGRAD